MKFFDRMRPNRKLREEMRSLEAEEEKREAEKAKSAKSKERHDQYEQGLEEIILHPDLINHFKIQDHAALYRVIADEKVDYPKRGADLSDIETTIHGKFHPRRWPAEVRAAAGDVGDISGTDDERFGAFDAYLMKKLEKVQRRQNNVRDIQENGLPPRIAQLMAEARKYPDDRIPSPIPNLELRSQTSVEHAEELLANGDIQTAKTVLENFIERGKRKERMSEEKIHAARARGGLAVTDETGNGGGLAIAEKQDGQLSDPDDSEE